MTLVPLRTVFGQPYENLHIHLKKRSSSCGFDSILGVAPAPFVLRTCHVYFSESITT
jgi:hypothetical protein